MTVAILIPAAGFGTRMRGADKLLQIVDGIPLLRRVALRALAATPLVIVTLPDLGGARAQAIGDLAVQKVPVPDAATGMAASLRRGAAKVPGDAAVMIVPADMPDLTSDDFSCIINAFLATPHAILQQGTAADGTPGHPVLFPPDCLPAFAKLNGDHGAKQILMANMHRLQRVELAGNHALIDLDTPEAWDAWNAARGQ
ncbi:nucleotidyltransferase family protein [Puniceibacterium sediminis]|uniref:CTP:molybdopterin cytidylyltransferase MocA n=1 Tax=Puniceibacterium sediminis TaxID=1608407 RepID=A0A238XM43_9RHOB|nr:nucleotidyltransferase family protein [Puniceibacterium sediminis]SNR59029.1 CTP:molybdopterin cytidylyltransferase MocA [Puniceibacterium sediminis]